MIPYFEEPALSIGPLTVSLFSILVVLAVIVGIAVLRRRAGHEGIAPAIAERLVWWALAGGFLGAHLVDRLAYFPGDTLRDPLSLLRVWAGMSAFGGFLGGIAGIVLFKRRVDLRPYTWRYVDSIAYAFPFGWIFGRLGCFVAFDHPGKPTDFFLGQAYQDLVVRHNLGLEEAVYTVFVAALFVVLGRRRRRPGVFTGLLAVAYAPMRFLLDYLRIGDARYLGLTPGQWGSIPLLLAGVAILVRGRGAAAAAASAVPEAMRKRR
jgi:phosphatidylglycerol:prolipoprotein diacylglycerol transferase